MKDGKKERKPRAMYLSGAVKKLNQSSVVEKTKINRRWIGVYFESGIFERWSFDIPTRYVNIAIYRQLPADPLEWIKKEIPILDEDPIGLEAVFQNNKGEIADNFLVKCEDIEQGGFFDVRILANKITLKVLLDGWLKPEFKLETLKKDWELLKKSYKPQDKKPKSIIMAQNLRGPRTKIICGYAIWSHFFDLGSYDGRKDAFKKCYDDPDIIMASVDNLINNNIKITRTNLLFSILKKSYKVKAYGPYKFKPNAYRDLLTRIFEIKNPVILDYTPDLGAKAVATVLCDGTYIYKDCPIMKWADKFAEFSGGRLIKDDGKKTADIGIIGGMGTYQTPSMELLSEVRKRSAYTLVFCRTGKQEKEILSYAPTKHIIKIMFGILNKGKILVYKQD